MTATAGAARSRLPAALQPLEEAVFRMLWFAWLAANITMWMNDVVAAWLMTTLTTSTTMVALVQAASTLPVFLLGVPSGALADIVDRRRYFAGTQLWVAANAIVLAVLSLADALSAPLLLALTFTNGIGLAMRWPVFAAIVPEVVSRDRLPAALALNGIAMNLSRVIGPMVAGAVLAALGGAWVFLLNAVLAIVSFVLILRWRRAPQSHALPGERFLGAMRVGLQHVAQSPRMRSVIARIFVFFTQTTALSALLPLIARQTGSGAGGFTALLACQGVGAIVAALLFPRWRARYSPGPFIVVGTVAHAIAAWVVVYAPSVWLAMPAMVVAGMAWISTANTLTVSAQMVLPDWVRARGMSIYQMALMGGSACGAAIWGQVADLAGLRAGVIGGAVFGLVAMLLLRRQRFDHTSLDDLGPWRSPAADAQPAIDVQPDDGPVMVTVEYLIDPADVPAFDAVMQETRKARRRQGVLSWGLFRDTDVPGRYVEYFVDESWVEHLRRLERLSIADAGLRDRRLALHRGDDAPRVKRYVAAPGGF